MTKKLFGSDHSLVAAEKVGGNEDLLREILLRSPAGSLIKFRAVSKQWMSFISDSQFARQHTIQSNPNSNGPSGIYYYNCLTDSQEIESISLDFGQSQRYGVGVPALDFLDVASEGAKIKIVQSCNGLLLCRFTYQSSVPEVIKYCVCNSSLKKYKLILQPDLAPLESILGFCLVFDPLKSPHFKVVCVKKLTRFGATHEVIIYTSENESWSSTGCRFEPPLCTTFCNGIYWNGVLHWISDDSIRCYSVQCDVSAKKYSLTQLPPKPRPIVNIGYGILVNPEAACILFIYAASQLPDSMFMRRIKTH